MLRPRFVITKPNQFRFFTFELLGIVFSVIFSFILHDLYKWSMTNVIVGLIAPVNESVWEHTKILVVPYLIWTIIELTMVKERFQYIVIAKAFGSLFLIIAMITFHYIYKGIVGRHIVLIDVLLAILWIILAYVFSTKEVEFLKSNSSRFNINKLFVISVVIIILIVTALIVFTFFPPKIELFRDLITGTYGIYGAS